MSEPLEPVFCQATLSEPQYEPVYNKHPPLQQEQDLNKARHPSQNHNTLEIIRQIINWRQNKNLQTPRLQCIILQSPIANAIDLSSSTVQSTPPTASQQTTSNSPSDYLGSTTTSEQSREKPFNPPATTEHLPYLIKNVFTQGEPNLVNDQIDVSSDTNFLLPETLSLRSTLSLGQIAASPFPPNFLHKSRR